MAQTKGLYLPETPAELSADWLSGVLRNEANETLTIDRVEQQVLGEGEGFLGDLLRLRLHYSDTDQNNTTTATTAPTSIIAKLPKLENRTMGELLGAYERENMFYLSLADKMPVAIPKLHYAEFDRDAGSEKQLEILQSLNRWPTWTHLAISKLGTWVASKKQRRYVLLIEDINDAQPGDQIAGADFAKAQPLLQALAMMHAKFWRSEQLEGHFWLLPLDIDGRMKHAVSKRSRSAFDAVFRDVLDAGLAPWVDDVMTSFVDDLDQLCTGPETLLHGDMRLDNVFFRDPSPEGVVFFDWQLVRRGPAAYDLAYLLSGALPPEFGSDAELLDIYHTTLTANGVTDYPREALQRDYELGLRIVLGSLIAVDQMQLGDDRGVQMIRLWIERLFGRLQALPNKTDTSAAI